ncbi:zinc-binding alcohol dehydrogenase family protein [Mucilaginibacter sp.]|uniref:quinone oxidoreductase family protein n=1 Tax=Mucilaginibacter sp. TaxID=1882438 RepID=UPI0032673418
MKAAVIHQAGDIPKIENIAEPIAKPHEQIVNVTAASIKNLDRMRAKGLHYDKYTSFPAVVGIDGVGKLEDGKRVYTSSPNGMMAERVAIAKGYALPIPANVDDVTAAALPNPAISAWLSLVWKGQLKKGSCVLISGATGITGKLAIQIAKHFGAAKIVATGRNPHALEQLKSLGADVVISLRQSDEEIKQALKVEAQQQPFDIVVDYLWAHPAELILEVLSGHDLNALPHPVRFIQVGEMAGSNITLPAAALRSSMIEICGVGGGSIPMEVLKTIPTQILPEIFRLAAEGKLTIETEAISMENVEEAWQNEDNGRRIVLVL